jgi:L-asparaginase
MSADGYLNLLNAVRVAAAPEPIGMGVLVVLNDTILSARDATKTATYRVETFQSRDLGPLGYADADGRVIYYHQPIRRHTTATEFALAGLTELPRVDVVISFQGADGTMIDAASAAGARGIVNGGTGSGRPTPGEEQALKRAQANGAVICQGSRVGSGRSVRSPGLTSSRSIRSAYRCLAWTGDAKPYVPDWPHSTGRWRKLDGSSRWSWRPSETSGCRSWRRR